MESRSAFSIAQDRSWPVEKAAALPRLSLVLPACNERDCIEQTIAEAEEALSVLTSDYEILVVDDGSSDDTAEIVREATVDRPRVRLLRHKANRGYGAALCTGFAAARFELIALSDADGQFHFEDLGRLLAWVRLYPIVVGCRAQREDTWRRRLLSRGYNLLARTLLGTGVQDCDCALKIFRREALEQLQPSSTGYLVNAEMLARARQLRLDVKEVDVRHRPRPAGTSKISLSDIPSTLRALLPFWWSRVLFPAAGVVGMEQGKGSTTPAARGQWLSFGLLLLIAGLLFATRLRAPLLEPQEPRYAEIARQMFVEGHGMIPVLHGQPYLDKPPLLYWLVMGCYQVCGIHDWAARLIPMLAGILTVLVTWMWGCRALGARAGLCGALCLCLTAGFVYRMRILGMDGLLCLWVTLGLAAAHLAIQEGRLRWGWWLTAALACSLGLLTKGPVSLALVGLPILVYGALEPRAARPGFRRWAAFLGLAVGLAAPWYLAVMYHEPTFAGTFFWTHHVERFLAPFDHSGPAWFYVPVLVTTLLPWTLLAPGFARFLARRPLPQAMRRPMALGYFLLAGVTCIGFFSLSGCKRPAYILPALPALALALGCYIDRWMPARAGWCALWRARCRPAYQLAFGLMVLALVVLGAAWLKNLVRPGSALLIAIGLVALLAVLKRHRSLSWAMMGGLSFGVLLVGVLYLLPAYNRQFALRGFRHEAGLSQVEGIPVVCYPQRWDSVSFYMPRAHIRAFGRHQTREMIEDLRSRPWTIVVVRSGKAAQELERALPPSLELVTRGRGGALTTGWVQERREAPCGLLADCEVDLDRPVFSRVREIPGSGVLGWWQNGAGTAANGAGRDG